MGKFLLEFAIVIFPENIADFELCCSLFTVDLGNHVGITIQNGFQLFKRDIQKVSDPAGKALKEPNVRNRSSQVYVSKAIPTNFTEGDLNAALLTDNTSIFLTLVLSTQALPVTYWTENTSTEQTVTLGLKGSIIDGFWLLDLTMRPGANFGRRGQANLYRNIIRGFLGLS
jgi:hypothetical protein